MFKVTVLSFESKPRPPSEKGWGTLGELKVCIDIAGFDVYINGIRVLRKEDKYIFSMPSRKDDSGAYIETVSFSEEHVYPMREAIKEALRLYNAKQAESSWAPAPPELPLEPSYPDGYVALARMPAQSAPQPSTPPARPMQRSVIKECPF